MDVRVGKLSTEELMLLNCGVGEDSWLSLGLQGDPTSPSSFFFFLLFFFKFYFIFKLYNIVLVLPNIEMNPKGDQSWVFIGRTDAEAETPVLWSPDAKNWLTGKDPAAGKDWRQEEKGTTENEMAEWHHRLDGHEFEWTPGVGDGQGSLACCSSWGHTELYTTEWLNWTLTILPYMIFSILSSLKQSGN